MNDAHELPDAAAITDGGLRERKACNLCGGTATTTVYQYAAGEYDHTRFDTASWDGRQDVDLAIVRCSGCGLVFSNPAFREEELGHVYPEDLVPTDMTFEKALRASKRKHRGMLRVVRRHLKTGVLCDIGTRYGCFPYLARRAGYDALGVEYNPRSVEVARDHGLPVYQGTCADLESIAAEAGHAHIDAFVMDDVLEHLTDPARDLRSLSRVQKRGDLIFTRQMDLHSLGHRLYGRNWYYIQPAAHMYYFDDRSIRTLFEKVGYRVLEVHRPGLLDNVPLTFAWRAKKGAEARLKRGGGAAKPSYLTQRRRTYDDMFLAVATKQ